MTKQHFAPCGDCPFTRKPSPGFLGDSPVEVYVGQYFLPYMVPCHACIDYSDPAWKEKATANPHIPQCVGFSMCRNGIGYDQLMPEMLLRVAYDPEKQAFRDIWDFWAYHRQVQRISAIEQLEPNAIMHMCDAELGRQGAHVRKGDGSWADPEDARRRMLYMVLRELGPLWTKVRDLETDRIEEFGPEPYDPRPFAILEDGPQIVVAFPIMNYATQTPPDTYEHGSHVFKREALMPVPDQLATYVAYCYSYHREKETDETE